MSRTTDDPEPSAMTGLQQSGPDAVPSAADVTFRPVSRSAPSAWSGSWAWSTRSRST